MQKKLCFELLTFLVLIEFKSAMYKTNDVKSPNPTYFLRSLRLPLTDKKYFLLLRCDNDTSETNTTSSISSIVEKERQHSNKTNSMQYGIINMLWSKTKVSLDIESCTDKYRQINKDEQRIATLNIFQHRNPFELPVNPTKIHVTTPSNIEFYYDYDIDHYGKNKKIINKTVCNSNTGSSLSSRDIKYRTVNWYKSMEQQYYPIFLKSYELAVSNTSDRGNVQVRHPIYKTTSTRSNDFLNAQNYTNFDEYAQLNNKEYTQNVSTFYDKVKFFEIYDDQTQTPVSNVNNSPNSTRQTKHYILENIRSDFGYDDNKTRRYVKKHIVDGNNVISLEGNKGSKENLNSTRTTVLFDLLVESKVCSGKSTKAFKVKPILSNNNSFINYGNKSIQWTEYPFLAVYVYKPLQIHCDAAGISPHWLIASASCLSRYHGYLEGNLQSPYVTYCGNNWWLPERVAYVKYSLVHPRYHPHEPIRRQLYNIGVIKIISSMASACPKWSPVPLMSHKFNAKTRGSKAVAVGWGLDRYDTKYTSSELPKRPLALYESLVYSESCPGKFEEYSNEKHLNNDDHNKNLYCLSLPPYSGEGIDPIHGGVLLVEEKLVALYLQEERRPWGEQSAQYTGTWRLIPWILDAAQEFDEPETFTIDV